MIDKIHQLNNNNVLFLDASGNTIRPFHPTTEWVLEGKNIRTSDSDIVPFNIFIPGTIIINLEYADGSTGIFNGNAADLYNLFYQSFFFDLSSGSGGGYWQKDLNGVWNDTDNIGIGTATPSQTLSVLGSSKSVFVDADGYQYWISSANDDIQQFGIAADCMSRQIYKDAQQFFSELIVNVDGTSIGGTGINLATEYYRDIKFNDKLSKVFQAGDRVQNEFQDPTLGIFASLSIEETVSNIRYADNLIGIDNNVRLDNGGITVQTVDNTNTTETTVSAKPTGVEISQVDTIVPNKASIEVSIPELLLRMFVNGIGASELKLVPDVGNGNPGFVLSPLDVYATNADAIIAGLVVGALYRDSSGNIKIVH